MVGPGSTWGRIRTRGIRELTRNCVSKVITPDVLLQSHSSFIGVGFLCGTTVPFELPQ